MNDQYYTAEPSSASRPAETAFAFRGRELRFVTDAGVFSRGELDQGTRVLLDALPDLGGVEELLDLGCGWGAIGVSLAAAYPDLRVTMADVNRRALGLAGANAAANGVADRCGTVESDGFAALAARRFDAVVTNPPIRAGKATIYRMFDEARAHLRPGGALYLVIRKQQGAESCIRYLKTLYARVEKLDRSGGFWVIRAEGALENGGENDVQQ